MARNMLRKRTFSARTAGGQGGVRPIIYNELCAAVRRAPQKIEQSLFFHPKTHTGAYQLHFSVFSKSRFYQKPKEKSNSDPQNII